MQAISGPGSGEAETETAFPALSVPAAPFPEEGGGHAQPAAAAVSAEVHPEVCSAARAKTRWNAQAAADARQPLPAAEPGAAPAAAARAKEPPLPLVGDAYYAAKERLIWVRVSIVALCARQRQRQRPASSAGALGLPGGSP